MTREHRSYLLPILIVTVTVGTLLVNALTPRDLSSGEDAAVWTTTGDLLAYDLSLALTGLVLFVAVVAIAVTVIREGLPRAGLVLWLSYLAFVVTNAVLPGVMGKVRGLEIRALYPALAFTAVYLARPLSTARFVALCKVVLGAFVYGSLVAAVVQPTQVLALNYSGLIPGLDARLYGVGGGATSLGAQAAALLALEAVSPMRSRLRLLHLLVAALVLLLTQLKTAWLFILLGSCYWAYRGLARRIPWLVPSVEGRMRPARILVYSSLALAFASFAFLLGRSLDVEALAGGESLQTLTGRTYIWTTSLEVWRESPMFGYGLGLWESDAFRAEHGSFGHAHNQFLHSLAGGGVLGLLGLLVYLRAAWRTATRAFGTTPVPLVLLALVLVFCLTDVPLRGYFVLDAFVLLHLLLFASLIQAERTMVAGSTGPGLAAERVPPELEIRPGEVGWPEGSVVP